MHISVMDQLIHSTVRIETTVVVDDKYVGTGTGTGFYMRFLAKNNHHVPVIVTNKHVVANASSAKFHVTLCKENNSDLPDIGNHLSVEIEDFEKNCIKHPDTNVDLVVFPLAPISTLLKKQGLELFYVTLGTELIPTEQERSSYTCMEDVVMIGYPNGIWDSKNNLPVIRKGITATHPGIDWNDNPEFLTDIASFPGSSGSPVFLANIGGYTDTQGTINLGGNRIMLLGVHYAGTVHTAEGEIKIVTAPTSSMDIPITGIPNNIGIVINSKELLVLEKEVERIINKQSLINQ